MKNVVLRAMLMVSVAVPSTAAFSQEFPTGPIRLIVGFSPGGATDLITRAVARGLTDILGQPIVVENVPGGRGTLALKKTIEAPPDGHTLMMITSNEPVQAVLNPNLPYKLERDLTPISQVAIGAYVLSVHPSMKAKNAAELVAYARANPGKLTYGSPGIGSGQHMAGELFKSMAQVDILHVPYKGGGEVMNALVAGQIDMTFGALPPSLPFIKADRVKALAVTSRNRTSSLPDVPTLDATGVPGYDRAGWFALTAPKGLTRALTDQLNDAVAKALRSQEVKEALNAQGLDPQPSTPDELAAFIRRELEQISKLAELAQIKVD